jgi:hypothetical protein
VNILEINDRDGIIIQSVTPARGGRLLGKCNGVGSTFVCENGGASSLDIVHVITYNHIFKTNGTTARPAAIKNVKVRCVPVVRE